MSAVKIDYYSDVLCIWAYVAERRLFQLVWDFDEDIAIKPRFCSVFPDAIGKIESVWKDRGSYEGFNAHVRDVAASFDHIKVNDRLWLDVRPRTSASAHLHVKAVEAVELERSGGQLPPFSERVSVRYEAALRHAFFVDGRDISDWDVLHEIAADHGVGAEALDAKIRSSQAVAMLTADTNLAQAEGVKGSPTYLMNHGRQKLFGNVGYRLLQANVQELLRNPSPNEASWC